MTLSTVEIITEKGASLQWPIGSSSDGFYIIDIDGLGPVKAEIVTSNAGTIDGDQYQASRRGARDIVLSLAIEPDYIGTTVSSLRQYLYTLLMPKSPIFLRFHMSDGLIVEIAGRVESFDWPLFSADPTPVISVRCFKPDFYKTSSVIIDGTTVETAIDQSILYEGNTENGVLFKLYVNRSIPGFTIYHTGPDGTTSSMDYVGSLLANDLVSISTVPGNKYIRRLRSGSEISVLYAVSQPSWIIMQPGMNQLRVVTAGLPIPFTIEYVNKYGGL